MNTNGLISIPFHISRANRCQILYISSLYGVYCIINIQWSNSPFWFLLSSPIFSQQFADIGVYHPMLNYILLFRVAQSNSTSEKTREIFPKDYFETDVTRVVLGQIQKAIVFSYSDIFLDIILSSLFAQGNFKSMSHGVRCLSDICEYLFRLFDPWWKIRGSLFNVYADTCWSSSGFEIKSLSFAFESVVIPTCVIKKLKVVSSILTYTSPDF